MKNLILSLTVIANQRGMIISDDKMQAVESILSVGFNHVGMNDGDRVGHLGTIGQMIYKILAPELEGINLHHLMDMTDLMSKHYDEKREANRIKREERIAALRTKAV